MPYRLDLTADRQDALRAVAAEQLADALAQLQDPAADPVKAVHAARKDLKKVRSLLRLGMRGKDRRPINDELRDIAAGLAGARDAEVMVATVASLHGVYAGRIPARAFTTVSRRFAKAAAAAEIDPGTLSRLEVQRDATAQWRFRQPDLATALARSYAQGREDLRASRRDPDAETLHAWRKRVKDLWYHARLLEDAWPGPLHALAKEAHVLSDHLGDDHDLGVLVGRFTAQEWPASVDADAFVALCQQRRAELQHEAFVLGAKLYAEKPKAFARRVAAYLGG